MSELSAPPPRAIVAGHAEFATGLVSAVDAITGLGDALVTLEVKGLCSQEIHALMRDTLVRTRTRVIFTDLQAGSCTMAARRVLREAGDVVLICGTNLPMLLDFVLSTESDPVVAATHAVERGRAAVSLTGGTP